MPLQFLDRDRSPFLGSLTKRIIFQSWGMTSSLQILLSREWRTVDETSPLSIQASGGMLSDSAAFLFFRAFKDRLTSATGIGPVRMSSSQYEWIFWCRPVQDILEISLPLIKFVVYSYQHHPVCILNQFALGSSSPTKQPCGVVDLLQSLCSAATSSSCAISSNLLLLSLLELLVVSWLFLLYMFVKPTSALWSFHPLTLVWVHVSLQQVSSSPHSSMPFYLSWHFQYFACAWVHFVDLAPLLLII